MKQREAARRARRMFQRGRSPELIARVCGRKLDDVLGEFAPREVARSVAKTDDFDLGPRRR